jgi:hypothetical protein
MNKNRNQAILFLVLTTFLVGCKKADGLTEQPTPTEPPNTPSILYTSNTPVQKPSSGDVTIPPVPATASITPTFTPTVRSTTLLSPTATMTVTPLASLSVIDSQKQFVDLLVDNGGCLYPCWFGFTPGKSSYSEVENFLRSFTTQYITRNFLNHSTFYFAFHNPPDMPIKTTLQGTIYGETKGYLQRVYFEVPTASYPVSRILTQYGPPDEIRLLALGYYMGLSEKGTFWVVLLYQDKGIMVEYEGYMDKTKTLDICFSPNQLRAYSRIFLWNPELKYSFTKAGSLMPLATKDFATEQDIQRDYHPIQEVSNLDIQSFYDQYRQDTNKGDCFQVPDLDWPIDN